MSISQVSQIARATKKQDKLNIAVYMAHERYEPNLCKTGHEFYAFPGEHVRKWNENYAPIPENYHVMPDQNIPLEVDFDLIISHNPYAHIPHASTLAQRLHVPIINIFHTLPMQAICEEAQRLFRQCNKHVFISDFNQYAWGFTPKNSEVIYHGTDTNLFQPGRKTRSPHILTVANDYIGRDRALGFSLLKELVLDNNLPYKPIGDTPGLSEATKDTQSLVTAFQEAQVFLNTSLHSPIPMSLIEAMACGCGVVTTNTCIMPDIIKHGENGYMFPPNKPEKGLQYLQELLADPAKAKAFGEKARETVLEVFGMDRFVSEWNTLLEDVVEKGYLYYA